MIITVDRDLEDFVMNTINEIDGVKKAQYIKLDT